MALNSSWWATGYEDTELVPDFSTATESHSVIPLGDGTGRNAYWSAIYDVFNLACPGGMFAVGRRCGDLVHGYVEAKFSTVRRRLDWARGSAMTPSGYTAGEANTPSELYYPFFTDHGDTDLDNLLTYVESAPGAAALCDLLVWQPRCWYGRAAAVVGAILRWAGVPADMIDTASFSDSHDAQVEYSPTADEEIKLFYRREPGQRLAETIMALARHSHDLLTVTMAGQIALVPRVNPSVIPSSTRTIATLDVTDGVIVADWHMATDHLTNYARAGHSRYVHKRMLGLYHVAELQNVASPAGYAGQDGWPWKEFEDAASATKYGEIPISTMQTKTYDERSLETVQVFHLPYIAPMAFGLTSPSPGAQARAAVTNYMARLDKDCKLRKQITVVQNMLGLDYDCGWRVRNVAVTDDGVVTMDTRCVRKVLNFRDMTVTSTLLEEPVIAAKVAGAAPLDFSVPDPDEPAPDELTYEFDLSQLIPAGGTTGQVLAKASDDDFDVEWVTP